MNDNDVSVSPAGRQEEKSNARALPDWRDPALLKEMESWFDGSQPWNYRRVKPSRWVEISEESWMAALEVLPPILIPSVRVGDAFAMSEPWTHGNDRGEPAYHVFARDHGRFFASLAFLSEVPALLQQVREDAARSGAGGA